MSTLVAPLQSHKSPETSTSYTMLHRNPSLCAPVFDLVDSGCLFIAGVGIEKFLTDPENTRSTVFQYTPTYRRIHHVASMGPDQASAVEAESNGK